MTSFKATAVYAVYNVGANTEERIFDTLEEADDWLELEAMSSGDYEAFWQNGSTVRRITTKEKSVMKLFTIYYTNVMQEQDSEVVASEERPTNEEALAYLIKNVVVGEHYDDGIEVYPTYVTDMDGNKVTVKVEEV